MGTVILVYEGLTEYLNHRTGWVVYHICWNQKTTFNFIAGPIRKEPPKFRLMTMEEIDWAEYPNDDKWRMKGEECPMLNSVLS